MIDAHIHYTKSLTEEKLNNLIDILQLEEIALQCIPGVDGLPVEDDAFTFKAKCRIPVWVFGGIQRGIYSEYCEKPKELSDVLLREAVRLIDMGCSGIKMLEGKPQIRKAYPIPDFDRQEWEPFWDYAETEQIPVFFHVNDPEEFWDIHKISRHALECGWLYDETFINNEEQYRQVLAVLSAHPELKIVFPHFFFLSGQLKRLDEILGRFPNVRIDITPGIELYFNLSRQRKEALAFFDRYQNRIIYGSDSGARQIVQGKGEPLSVGEGLQKSPDYRVSGTRGL